jgi:hypothetical protein
VPLQVASSVSAPILSRQAKPTTILPSLTRAKYGLFGLFSAYWLTPGSWSSTLPSIQPSLPKHCTTRWCTLDGHRIAYAGCWTVKFGSSCPSPCRYRKRQVTTHSFMSLAFVSKAFCLTFLGPLNLTTVRPGKAGLPLFLLALSFVILDLSNSS